MIIDKQLSFLDGSQLKVETMLTTMIELIAFKIIAIDSSLRVLLFVVQLYSIDLHRTPCIDTYTDAVRVVDRAKESQRWRDEIEG